MKILSDLPTVRFLLLFLDFTAALTVTTTTAQAQAAPDIVVETLAEVEIPNGTAHNFGNVEVREITNSSHYVRVWNRGTAPLVITQFGPEGGDTGPFTSYGPAVPAQIAVGAYVQLSTKFDPTGPGVKSTTFVILSSDPDEPLYELPLTGTGIEPQMVVETAAGAPVAPLQTQDYGIVGMGANKDMIFALKNPGTAPLRVSYSLFGTHAS